MKRFLLTVVILSVFCGCAEMCLFGRSDTASGVKCHGFFNQAKIGMTQKEVKDSIGTPQQKNIDVTLRGKKYDETWIYDTMPPTVLYFNNGVLQQKEYGK